VSAYPPDEPGAKARLTHDLEPPAIALAIGAHPDDIEFSCGGTLAKWAAAGTEVHLLILTDGSKGTWDPHADPAALLLTRETEARAAAAELGAHQLHLLRLIDGELDSSLATRGRVCETIRRVKPNVVLGHDPWKRYRIHPDHRHAGWLAVEGIFGARDPHFFPEQLLAAHRADTLLLFEAEFVDHVEDVAATVDAKTRALLRHESQWRSTLGIEPGDAEGAEQFRVRRREIAADLAARYAVTPAITAVEAFKRIDDL
jgi:LmbE family N-acetylglucosaminyl deacetylase